MGIVKALLGWKEKESRYRDLLRRLVETIPSIKLRRSSSLRLLSLVRLP